MSLVSSVLVQRDYATNEHTNKIQWVFHINQVNESLKYHNEHNSP